MARPLHLSKRKYGLRPTRCRSSGIDISLSCFPTCVRSIWEIGEPVNDPSSGAILTRGDILEERLVLADPHVVTPDHPCVECNDRLLRGPAITEIDSPSPRNSTHLTCRSGWIGARRGHLDVPGRRWESTRESRRNGGIGLVVPGVGLKSRSVGTRTDCLTSRKVAKRSRPPAPSIP
jgi:hypothetical protein